VVTPVSDDLRDEGIQLCREWYAGRPQLLCDTTFEGGQSRPDGVLIIVRRLALLAVGLSLFSTNLHAQEQTPPPAPGPITESADRIAREWWPTDPQSFTVDDEGRPRFRGGVTETVPPPPWQPTPDLSPTPSRGAISHQEMLRMMTPQEFSTPLISGSVDPGSIVNAIKKAWREREERRVHERVMKELEELYRLNEAAAADSQ